MGIDGITYHVKLGDLSQGGALVEMGDNVSHGLHVGELCGLMLSDNLTSCPAKYTGMIVRLESGSVAISFNRQEIHHQKKKYIAP
jgi:hypothetical protein